jgi:DNA polymerase-3 subunit delta
MRLRPDQLAGHFRKNLASIYLVYGEEWLVAQEAADTIRAAARDRGHHERECLTVTTTGFDWSALRQLAASPSLFANRRLLELRLGEAKPGDAGSKALVEYAGRPADDAVLLISAGKLDGPMQKSRWFTALEEVGVTVPAAALELRQLPGWIEKRFQTRSLQPTPEAVALLCERVEGNLLAAAQEIDKLALSVSDRQVTAEAIMAAVGDSSRFSIYDFVDAALLGQPERTARILYGLRSEGVEPVLANWALHREVRIINALAFALNQRRPLDPVFTAYKVWDKRKPPLQQTLQRLTFADCRRVLGDCARTDRIIKGMEPGSPWDALLANGLRLAGVELFKG